jgi:hypothetical protein
MSWRASDRNISPLGHAEKPEAEGARLGSQVPAVGAPVNGEYSVIELVPNVFKPNARESGVESGGMGPARPARRAEARPLIGAAGEQCKFVIATSRASQACFFPPSLTPLYLRPSLLYIDLLRSNLLIYASFCFCLSLASNLSGLGLCHPHIAHNTGQQPYRLEPLFCAARCFL